MQQQEIFSLQMKEYARIEIGMFYIRLFFVDSSLLQASRGGQNLDTLIHSCVRLKGLNDSSATSYKEVLDAFRVSDEQVFMHGFTLFLL
jgi:hypothetical protein